MSRRLLLEGPDLDALVARARREHGPRAKVVQAERVRSGGVGGFFAKEYFEVLVDVPDDDGLVPGASAVGPSSLEDLLDAADAAEARAAGVDAPPSAGLSTDGSDFAEVLDRVRALVAAQGVAPSADVPAVRPRALRAVPDDLEQPDALAAVRVPAPSRLVQRPVVAPRSGVTVPELLEVGVPSEVVAAALGHVPPSPGVRVALSSVLVHVEKAPAVVRPDGGVIVVVGESGVVTAVAEQVARRAGVAPSRIVLAGDHDRAGFPAEGGPGADAPNDQIRLVDVEDAALLAERLAVSHVAVVVALAVPAHRAGRERAVAMLDVLRPVQLWAAVDVGRSSVETRRWLALVRDHRTVDALGVVGVEGSSAPAHVLSLGVPVGMLDGLAASAPVWAATLAERLDDAVWD
ncbi:hypothetical protein [Sanguibacter sp. HDW7]|uniref:hypothetical protein n=1 Tax=Sanguibacter sp. HDW7 TaxID=2714931 RepID=UPI00140975EE|nr:hypothetical protein [Sanguibacter sp. HDW7]QIK84290.1 hypothetical protein G7063_12190 [Sanguibacter sp. HDW7]